jgi:hypothetical protein
VHWFRILIDQLRTLVDLIFGYDYFISYSRSDGANYPTKLADRLETFGYRTFLDNRFYVAGTDLQTATKRRVRMSKFLIVVGREKALKSEWVVKEVHRSLEANRVPILIDINEPGQASTIVERSDRAALDHSGHSHLIGGGHGNSFIGSREAYDWPTRCRGRGQFGELAKAVAERIHCMSEGFTG